MKVSIITVNLNGNRFLAESIDSVLGQDYREVELLIIDGGSTDGSLVTIEEAAGQDSRVRWISEKDRGIADAMNKGITLATGDIIGFLHSDDRYPGQDVISQVVAAFASRHAALWLTGGISLITEAGVPFCTFEVRRYSYKRLIRSNILFHPSTFVRKETLRSCQFDANLRLAMDYDLWLRLGALGDPLLMDQPLSCFRVHQGSRSLQAADEALAEEFAIRHRFLASRGRLTCPYRLHYMVKRVLNRIFIRGLLQTNAEG
jgi:glycosyltransferase involved in cell wall biosynthesis